MYSFNFSYFNSTVFKGLQNITFTVKDKKIFNIVIENSEEPSSDFAVFLQEKQKCITESLYNSRVWLKEKL